MPFILWSPDWFRERFGTPTEPQIQGWEQILARRDTLIAAPTGSGKTLAAFLAALDSLIRQAADGRLDDRTQVLLRLPSPRLEQRHPKEFARAAPGTPRTGGTKLGQAAGDPRQRPHRRHAPPASAGAWSGSLRTF